MCGFKKMVPQRTLQTSQWPLFETCFPGTSFPISETCRGPLTLPIFQRVIFLWGYLKSRVYAHNPRTLNDLRVAIRQEFVRSIVSCWPVSWKILKIGLKILSSQTVVILPTSFLKLNHLVWHVLSFNFVKINVNLLEKQLSTVYFKDVRFPCVILYIQ